MLIILALFGQIIFMTVADFVYQGMVTIQLAFGLTYLMCAMLQVITYTLFWLFKLFWKTIVYLKKLQQASIFFLTLMK